MITKEQNDLIAANLNRFYTAVHSYQHFEEFVEKEEADKVFSAVFNYEVNRFASLISEILSQERKVIADKVREEVTKEVYNKIRSEKIGLKIITNEKENIC